MNDPSLQLLSEALRYRAGPGWFDPVQFLYKSCAVLVSSWWNRQKTAYHRTPHSRVLTVCLQCCCLSLGGGNINIDYCLGLSTESPILSSLTSYAPFQWPLFSYQGWEQPRCVGIKCNQMESHLTAWPFSNSRLHPGPVTSSAKGFPPGLQYRKWNPLLWSSSHPIRKLLAT